MIDMKQQFSFSIILIILFLNSCGSSPVRKSFPTASNKGSTITPSVQTEREYQALIKTYKSETAEVLTDLLNGSSNNPKTSITVENKSSCNMVLTISGNNYFKKIPIGAKKIGSAMILKNQNYNLSGMLCNAVYQNKKFITSSYNITLSN